MLLFGIICASGIDGSQASIRYYKVTNFMYILHLFITRSLRVPLSSLASTLHRIGKRQRCPAHIALCPTNVISALLSHPDAAELTLLYIDATGRLKPQTQPNPPFPLLESSNPGTQTL